MRLNAFQLLMRRWSTLHPYNAGQVMHLSGAPDPDRWKHAVETVIGQLGLGAPTFSHKNFEVRYSPVSDIAIEQTASDFRDFVNEELNRPFPPNELPIRFCILPRSDGTHYLAAFYDHWIGDSRAMRDLMQRIFLQYANPEAAARLEPLTLDAPAFDSLFRHHMGRLPRSASIRESLKNIWHHRHAFRLNLNDPLNFDSRYIYRTLPEGLIERVYQFAKSHNASVNDVFVAALGQTMGQFTAVARGTRITRKFHFKRQNVGIGTIVDIRDAAKTPLDRVFNLYLSSYTVMLDYAELSPMDKLVEQVAAYTQRVKKRFTPVKGYAALVMARHWWDLYKNRRYQAQFFHKTVPVAAGISNVNMTKSWADQPYDASDDSPQILDYLRISPTGPLLPLVFTLTTIRDRLSLCVTYRSTAFSDEVAGKLVTDFIRRLSEIAP